MGYVHLTRTMRTARTRGPHRRPFHTTFAVLLAFLPGLHVLAVPIFGEPVSSKSPVCDDSKCQSPGIVAFPYTLGPCFAEEDNPNTTFVFGCADGYGVYKLNSTLGTFSYYTCCRPDIFSGGNDDATGDSENDQGLSKRPRCSRQACSSPSGVLGMADCWADGPYEPMTCSPKDKSNIYKYPRKTGAFLQYNTVLYSDYTCCDSLEGSSAPLKPSYVAAEVVRVTLGSVAITCVLGLTLGILSSAKTRVRSYNIYLIALAIPDLAYNILVITIGAKALSGRDHISCSAMNSVGYFYMAANIYLNAVIAYMVHMLLRNSKQRKRTSPPSGKLISKQIAAVYSLATCFGIWGMFSVCRGAIDYTADEHTRQIVVTLTMLALALLPFVYLAFVCFDVWRNDLLPRSGRTRVLSLYFLKIVMTFILFWTPAILLLNLEPLNTTAAGGMHYAAWYLSSIQGIVATIVAMLKPDVRKAVVQLATCKINNDSADMLEGRNDFSSRDSRLARWWSSNSFGSSVASSSFFARLSLSSSLHRKSSMPMFSNDFEKNIAAFQASEEGRSAAKEDNDWHDEERGVEDEGQRRKVRFKRQSNRQSWNISSVASVTEEADAEAEAVVIKKSHVNGDETVTQATSTS